MRFLVTGGTGFIGWRVVRALAERGIPTVAADWSIDPDARARLERAYGQLVSFVFCDVSDFHQVLSVFRQFPGITHAIHLAYLMSAEVESDPHLGARVNVVGMVNLFEAAAIERLSRLVFTSSETVYGASQQPYGDRPIKEEDCCSPADHFFTYGVMKLLNEFMAQKFVQRHEISIVCTRPPVVFGHGRKRGSVLWAEEFVSLPAVGKPVKLPFPSANRDCWIYVDDCAEQLVRLALKPQVSHLAYNTGGHSVPARDFADMVRRWLPSADISFDENGRRTPLVDALDGSRLAAEIDFTPRPLRDGILAHINEARAQAGMAAIAAA